MEVRVLRAHRVGLVLGEVLDPLGGLEVVLDPELLAAGVHPAERVAAVAVHVPVGARRAAVGHQDHHLVRALGRERPEVPLHVVGAHARVRQALLGVDEVLELRGVADEEDRRVVADQVVVALLGIELQREPARVAHRVGEALLAGDGREAREHRCPHPWLEQARLGELADVVGDLEEAVGAAALGVHDALGHALTVEVLDLLDRVVVVEHGRALRADGQRELVAGSRDARVGGGRRPRLVAHRCLLGETKSPDWTTSGGCAGACRPRPGEWSAHRAARSQ